MNIEYIIEGGVRNNFITIIIDNKRQYNFENNKEALEFVLKECNLTLSEEEIVNYVELIKGAKNYTNSPYIINEEEMLDIYRKHFARKRGK